jgi:hypothetical protein
MTDSSAEQDWSPDTVAPYSGDSDCQEDGCDREAEWTIEYIDQHANHMLFSVCDKHIEDRWGYHPDDEQ